MWLGIDERAADFEAFGDDLIGCLAAEDALAPGIIGGIEAAKELLEIAVGVDGDPQHLVADAALKRSTIPFVCGV